MEIDDSALDVCSLAIYLRKCINPIIENDSEAKQDEAKKAAEKVIIDLTQDSNILE